VAVPYAAFGGGRMFETRGARIFLYSDPQAELFESTLAFRIRAGVDASTCRFDASNGGFPEACADPVPGFDTFWYSWSNNDPGTYLLGGP